MFYFCSFLPGGETLRVAEAEAPHRTKLSEDEAACHTL